MLRYLVECLLPGLKGYIYARNMQRSNDETNYGQMALHDGVYYTALIAGRIMSIPIITHPRNAWLLTFRRLMSTILTYRTANLESFILYIYSTNIGTDCFKHGIYSAFFALQNAVCFIILTYLVPVLFTFCKQGVLKFKKIIPPPKG